MVWSRGVWLNLKKLRKAPYLHKNQVSKEASLAHAIRAIANQDNLKIREISNKLEDSGSDVKIVENNIKIPLSFRDMNTSNSSALTSQGYSNVVEALRQKLIIDKLGAQMFDVPEGTLELEVPIITSEATAVGAVEGKKADKSVLNTQTKTIDFLSFKSEVAITEPMLITGGRGLIDLVSKSIGYGLANKLEEHFFDGTYPNKSLFYSGVNDSVILDWINESTFTIENVNLLPNILIEKGVLPENITFLVPIKRRDDLRKVLLGKGTGDFLFNYSKNDLNKGHILNYPAIVSSKLKGDIDDYILFAGDFNYLAFAYWDKLNLEIIADSTTDGGVVIKGSLYVGWHHINIDAFHYVEYNASKKRRRRRKRDLKNKKDLADDK